MPYVHVRLHVHAHLVRHNPALHAKQFHTDNTLRAFNPYLPTQGGFAGSGYDGVDWAWVR